MRCPDLVGRERELEALDEGLDPARPAVIWVVGEAGVGKTRLLAELSRRAAASGRQLVTCRATPVDRRTPYRPITEALLACNRDETRPVAAALAPLLGAAPADHTLLPPVVLAESALRTFADAGRGLVLVMEDLHWADPDSLAVVEHLVQHGRDVGLTVVFSSRPPLPDFAHRDGIVLELDRLGSAQAEAMAGACLGRELDGDERAVVTAAEGLPLLIEDFLAAGAPERSRRFDDLVRQRLGALSTGARLVVEAAALAGERVPVEVLAEATGLERHDLSRALRELADADLLESTGAECVFRHALTRDAVLDDLVADPADLAPRVARALQCHDGAPGVVAELWRIGGDLEAALASTRDGARRAEAQGALATAEALLRRGREIAPTGSRWRAGLALDLARVLLTSGQLTVLLDQAPALLRELSSPEDLTDLRLTLARGSLAAGRLDEARRLVDVVRRGPGQDSTRAAELAVLDAQVALAASEPGRVTAARHLAGQAIGLARGADLPELECAALETAALCARTQDLAAAERDLARGLQVADRAGLRTWRLRFLNELGALELLQDARGDLLEQALAEATDAGALGVAAGVMVNLVSVSVMCADWDAATGRIAETERLAQRLGLTPLVGANAALEAVGWACRGDRGRTEVAVRRAAACSPGDSDLSAMTSLAVGLLSLVEEERESAVHALEGFSHVAVARTLDAPVGPALLLACLAGTAGTADVQAARTLVVRGARWGEFWQSCAEAVQLGPVDPAAAVERRGCAVRAGLPTPVFATLGLRLVAEAALRDGWGEPARWLAEAERSAADLGLVRVASACRALLLQAGGRAVRRRAGDLPVPAALRVRGVTAREAEVLDLVADRLQNREIASRLFLSPRTVEKHVASLLRKCDTGNRAGLVAFARDARMGRLG